MEVVMRIDVIEPQAGRVKRRELCVDLRGELPAHAGTQKDVQAHHREVRAQQPIAIDEVRYRIGRRRRGAVDQNEMQTDSERWQATGAGDRVIDGASAHHQARCRQNALRMRDLDGLVDLRCQAEIVGRDNQRFQCKDSRRSRRKWKNSTPSRSRRFIMSGLLTISPTIDAILPLRK